MYIRNFRIENVTCFENAQLSFVDEKGKIVRWTVILGENGTGKSTILRSIALLLAGVDVAGSLEPEPWKMVRFGRDEAYAEAEVDIPSSRGSKRREKLKLAVRFLREPYSKGLVPVLDADRSVYEELLLRTRGRVFLCGYGATRVAPRSKRSSRAYKTHPRVERLQTLFAEEAVLTPVEEWLQTLEYDYLRYRKKSRAAGEPAFEKAVNALNGILPSVKFKQINRDGEAIFDTPYGEAPLSELSRGYQDVLTWVSDLIRNLLAIFPESKNPLHEEGIVLLEEIALHLHPQWQQKVIGFLRRRFPKLQFIATTHSPLAAQSLERNEFVTLKQVKAFGSHKDTVSVTRYMFSPKGLSADQILTSPMFGLSSAKSKEVQSRKRELAQLKSRISRGKASTKDQDRYSKLISFFEAVPEIPGDSFEQREFFLTMEQVLKGLGREDLLERPPLEHLRKKSHDEDEGEEYG